jgi:CheY-like chemotaxis protein
MDCYCIINNFGSIISCKDEFTTCTGLSNGDNMLHQIDRSVITNDADHGFIANIMNIVVGTESDTDFKDRNYRMVTIDGWKYSAIVERDVSHPDIKIRIPHEEVNERLGTYVDHLILQSSLCSVHPVQTIKVLMVDDSAVTCKIAKRLIESTGSICDIMCDARDFIGFNKELLTSYYNIIIVDINMPHISGYDICKVLRSFCPSSVILIGTSTDTSDLCIRRCEKEGFSFFLNKPYSINNVVDMLYMYKLMTL